MYFDTSIYEKVIAPIIAGDVFIDRQRMSDYMELSRICFLRKRDQYQVPHNSFLADYETEIQNMEKYREMYNYIKDQVSPSTLGDSKVP